MSFESDTYNADDEAREVQPLLDPLRKRRELPELEKLDLYSKELEVRSLECNVKLKELEVKSLECDVKLKEQETRKRIREIEYELLDKPVDRCSALLADGVMDKELEDDLKCKYRRMIKDV